MPSKLPTWDEYLKQLQAQGDAVRRIADTPDGKVLFELLESRFLYGRLKGVTPEDTYFNLGAREIVMALRRLRETPKPGES